MQFQNATVVEKFVRKNILPTRNTIVVAFATILSSLLAAVIPTLFVSIMMQAFLPKREEQGAAKSTAEMKPAAEHDVKARRSSLLSDTRYAGGGGQCTAEGKAP